MLARMRLLLVVLVAAGCVREVRRAVPIAVYGEERRVVETREELPDPPDVVPSETGRIAVLGFTGASELERDAVSQALQRGLATRLSGDAIAPDRCAGRSPCFSIVTEDLPEVTSSPPGEGAAGAELEPALAAIADRAEHAVLGELAEADGATRVSLSIVDVSARSVVWHRETEVADAAALADLVASAFATARTDAEAAPRTVRTVEVRRGLIGLDRREVTAYELTGRFSFQSEIMTRLAPLSSTLEIALAVGVSFGNGPVYHRFHLGGTLVKQIANTDCRDRDFGGGAFARYGLTWDFTEYFYLGGYLGAGFNILETVDCSDSLLTPTTEFVDIAHLAAAIGFRLGIFDVGITARGAYGVADDEFSASFLLGPQITIEPD
jgi:hypothetical protein